VPSQRNAHNASKNARYRCQRSGILRFVRGAFRRGTAKDAREQCTASVDERRIRDGETRPSRNQLARITRPRCGPSVTRAHARTHAESVVSRDLRDGIVFCILLLASSSRRAHTHKRTLTHRGEDYARASHNDNRRDAFSVRRRITTTTTITAAAATRAYPLCCVIVVSRGSSADDCQERRWSCSQGEEQENDPSSTRTKWNNTHTYAH